MQEVEFFTIDEEKESKIEVKKSRFLGFAKYIETETQAKGFIDSLRKKYFDACHVCYAYILHDGTIKSSDDGEPSGTAGTPILDTIKNKNLKDTIIVVVRYFGGILLGASNLYRAYIDCAKEVMKDIKICKMQKCLVKNIVLSYENYAKFENYAKNSKIVIIDRKYGEITNFKIALPVAEMDNILNGAPLEFKKELAKNETSELFVKAKV